MVVAGPLDDGSEEVVDMFDLGCGIGGRRRRWEKVLVTAPHRQYGPPYALGSTYEVGGLPLYSAQRP